MLGRIYEDMVDKLMGSDRPFYLTDDQRELYDMGLEDKAYPVTEKAVQAYTLTLDRSYTLTLYNENTAFATRRLGDLRPDDFPGLHEELIVPRFTTSAGRSTDFETEL